MAKYLQANNLIQRLINEYLEHGKLIIAYDFDDTVCTYTKGNPEPTRERKSNVEICELIHALRPYADFIVWTCRSNETKNPNEDLPALDEAIRWLDEHNMPYDYINTDGKVNYGGRKIYANALLDDRAGLASIFDALHGFLNWVERSKDNG